MTEKTSKWVKPDKGETPETALTRMRALIKGAEWSGRVGYADNGCPWCDVEEGGEHTDCPAFDTRGEVR